MVRWRMRSMQWREGRKWRIREAEEKERRREA
jgi:hypothetical protein